MASFTKLQERSIDVEHHGFYHVWIPVERTLQKCRLRGCLTVSPSTAIGFGAPYLERWGLTYAPLRLFRGNPLPSSLGRL